VSLPTSSISTVARRGSGVPLLILAGISWGTGGVLGSLLGRETGLSPLAVAAYRLGLGGLLVLVAVGGIALAGRPPAPRRGRSSFPGGAGAAVAAGSAFATMTLVGAVAVPGLDAMVATGASFLVGGLLLAVPAALLGGPAFPTTLAGAGLLTLFAVVPTALAYTAYFRGLAAGTSPGTGAVLALLEPLTAAILAAVVLGERLGVAGIIGALLLGAAVLLAALADRSSAGPSGTGDSG
jgi:drug/metabolite transporter, DME family